MTTAVREDGEDRVVRVLAIHLGQRLVLRDDDVLGDIRQLMDEDEDETDDIEEAVVAIVEWRDGGWTPLLIDDYDFDDDHHILN